MVMRLNLLMAGVCLAATASLLLAQDKKPEPPAKATAKDLAGRWESNIQQANPYAWISFEENGAMSLNTRVDNANQYSAGRFKIEDNKIKFIAEQGLRISSTFVINEYKPDKLSLTYDGGTQKMEFVRKIEKK
jgi:uncharacterized protein (TIGR03066 family)